jgi:transcriptional regulator with XRE-family HTH domain
MKNVTAFSTWLIDRMGAGIGVNQLALQVGLSPSAISKLRLGKSTPDPSTVKKLADWFGDDFDRVLALAGHREPGEVENPWQEVTDPELKMLLVAENINQLSESSKRAIAAIIKSDLSQKQQK